MQDVKTRLVWDLVLIYGDAQPEKKARFLVELSRVLHDCINPILIGETLTSLGKLLKKNNPSTPGHWSFLFNVILKQAGLRELEMQGRKFTWGNNMPSPTYEKLDRILCSVNWEENYPLSMVTALVREKSDHTPLLMDTGDVPKTDPFFRFENS